MIAILHLMSCVQSAKENYLVFCGYAVNSKVVNEFYYSDSDVLYMFMQSFSRKLKLRLLSLNNFDPKFKVITKYITILLLQNQKNEIFNFLVYCIATKD